MLVNKPYIWVFGTGYFSCCFSWMCATFKTAKGHHLVLSKTPWSLLKQNRGWVAWCRKDLLKWLGVFLLSFLNVSQLVVINQLVVWGPVGLDVLGAPKMKGIVTLKVPLESPIYRQLSESWSKKKCPLESQHGTRNGCPCKKIFLLGTIIFNIFMFHDVSFPGK